MKALQKLVIFLFASSVMTLILEGGKTQVPPGSEVRRDGMLIVNRGIVRSLGLDEKDMLSLVYGLDEIPKFVGQQTVIKLNVGGERERGGISSRILRVWTSERAYIRIECEVGLTKESAQARLELILNPTYSSGARMFRQGSFSGLPIGDKCWRNPWANTLFFTVGKVFIIVQVLGPPEIDGLFAEALAVGVEYFIHLNPKRLVEASKPMTVLVANQSTAQGKAVALAGVTVAPLSALEPAKVTLRTVRNEKEWATEASLNGRWVKVKAFSWEMETERGKVKLERPVFPCKGELIIPLKQVAEALGIKVQQKGQTIALLPK